MLGLMGRGLLGVEVWVRLWLVRSCVVCVSLVCPVSLGCEFEVYPHIRSNPRAMR